MRRVGLVGAGFIARVHAEALRTVPEVAITCVIDPRQPSARALARDSGDAPVFASVEQALAADALDCAHVLVPPDLHAAVAGVLIAAGKPVLLEKPLAATADDARALVDQAGAGGVTLGVNQNFVHHPAFRRLCDAVRRNSLGPARHVACIYNVPLRQITARQFSHWMFASPLNLLLEQAVHPLSQIVRIAGQVGDVRLLPGASLAMPGGHSITPTFDALLAGEHLPASLRFAVGQAYPFWQIQVTCDDGIAVADILANRFVVQRRTRWLEAVDGVMSGAQTAGALFGSSVRNVSDYGLSQLRLKPRSDAFFQSMQGSIAAFHAALTARQEPAAQRCLRIVSRATVHPHGRGAAGRRPGGLGRTGAHHASTAEPRHRHSRRHRIHRHPSGAPVHRARAACAGDGAQPQGPAGQLP